MHEDYDDYENAYDDDSQNYPENPYKHYFKFDPQSWDMWGKLLGDMFENIVEPSSNVWYVYGYLSNELPVNSYISNTGKGDTFQYLGNNYDNVKVWKKKYFVIDPIQQEYIHHIQNNAKYFLKQPSYYKGLFDILN